METKASYVLIGGFTLGILIVAFLFVLWLAKWQVDREWDYYDILFKEAVTGLSVGSAVQYNGIQVGEVRRLSLDKADPRQVIARVRVNSDTPIKMDTKAKLTFTGLTGVAAIQLTGGLPKSPKLTIKGKELVPTLIAEESALQKLLASSEGMVASVNDLLLRLSELLSHEQLNKIAATINHIEKISRSVADRSDDIGHALSQIAQASSSMKNTLTQTESLMKKLEHLTDTSQVMLNTDAKQLLIQARTSLESAKKLTDSAQQVVSNNQNAITQFSQQAGPTLHDLRSTLQSLQRLTDELEKNPSALLLGSEKPKEYEAR
jgi:phospholipid/cholesterol/gamma-HCH transport system substrate-binding protein